MDLVGGVGRGGVNRDKRSVFGHRCLLRFSGLSLPCVWHGFDPTSNTGRSGRRHVCPACLNRPYPPVLVCVGAVSEPAGQRRKMAVLCLLASVCAKLYGGISFLLSTTPFYS